MASSCLWWLPIKTFLKSNQCFVFQEYLQITLRWIEKTHWWNTWGKDRFCFNGIWSYSTIVWSRPRRKKRSHCNFYSVVGFDWIWKNRCNMFSNQKLNRIFLKKWKTITFLINLSSNLGKRNLFQFCKEWSKHNSHIPNYQDLEKYFSLGSKWNKLAWAVPG